MGAERCARCDDPMEPQDPVYCHICACEEPTESRCMWCGAISAREDAAIRSHLATCPDHPLHAAEARVRELEARLAAMPTREEVDDAISEWAGAWKNGCQIAKIEAGQALHRLLDRVPWCAGKP